jgi:hypothetical protein
MLKKIEKGLRYARLYGWRQFLREVLARIARKFRRPPPPPSPVDARELLKKRRLMCAPLQMFSVPRAEPGRISLVTDSINRGSLYGGVATAIIMAALVAEAKGVRLRIITRTQWAEPSELQILLEAYGITLSHDIEFVYAPLDSSSNEMDVFEDELFITTSWWTTAATLASVGSESIVYLLQEDERMFYAHGDSHLMCSQVLENKDIRFVVNTRLLYDHLVGSGLANIGKRGIWFEPSFPSEVFHPRERAAGARPTLTFYARADANRNLFHFGVEIIETAITRGIIDLRQWDVVFVGRDIPSLRLDDGRYAPQRHENLSWTAYAELAGQSDLALCLMYTPHPSYPPFDFAASGAVVITNRFGNKRDLGGYSANILCGDLDLEAMLETFERGVALALDAQRRNANFRAQQLGADWKRSLAPVIEYIGGAR